MHRTARSLLSFLLLVTITSGRMEGAETTLETSLRTLAQTIAGALRTRGVKKIATFDFIDIRGYRSALDAFIAEELISQILNTASGTFTFVERRQLNRIVEEQKLTSSAMFDERSLAKVGKILGLDAIVTGSISDLGSQIRINARAVAVETGEVFSAASVSIPKDGPVAELLRQNGRPEDATGLPSNEDRTARRTVQASDVFFENQLIRLTVASAGMSADKRNVSLALVLENRANGDLVIGIPMADATGGCSMAISDASGNLLRVDRFKIAGLPCIHSIDEKQPDVYARVAPRSRTTVVANVYSQRPVGTILSVAMEFTTLTGDRMSRFSAGIANIEAQVGK